MTKAIPVSGEFLDATDVTDVKTEPIISGDVQAFIDIVDAIKCTYIAKNNDYGSAIESGMNELGMMYLISQLHNKLSRLKSLSKPNTNQKVKEESLQDTLIDLAVYSLEGARTLDKLSRGESLVSIKPDEFLEELRRQGAERI